ncbi:hypothetical protein [Metaplanococcus flavidus]|uniref:Type 4 fimbrial biogenesis protein PilX N-terminal domain-containing protein n=1 Tax=Metaplanococcus flavidus TaxID=569883 RepID=A0ABW3L9Z2_9BACL
MNQVKNQQGYALLVVLLMVLLFMGIAATFMAGSLSNAKQEQTVDTSNQAVASAEMGVKYHSADFQREIGIIKSAIIEETQDEIKTLVECFNSGNSNCDTQEELDVLEQQINKDMKEKFVDEIYKKVGSLVGHEKTPFPSVDSQFTVKQVEMIDRDVDGKDITQTQPPLPLDKNNPPSPTLPWYEEISSLEVKLTLNGKSNLTTKELKGIFTIEVPDTFLSAENKLTVNTVTKVQDLEYDDIFLGDSTGKTCEALKSEIVPGVEPATFDCELDINDSVESFVDWLKSKGQDPEKFTVFIPSFNKNVCGGKSQCNSVDIGGITVVVSAGDTGLVGNNGNMNNLNNANLIIDGHFQVDQFQNPGKKNDSSDEEIKSQTIIMRELTVNKHMHGQGLENTNLLILGRDTDIAVDDGVMDFNGKVTIGDNGLICFDMDRIDKDDWEALRDKVEFKGDDATGQIIYYTKDYQGDEFILPAGEGLSSAKRTFLYVEGFNNYTNFLSSCGVTVTESVNEITDIPVPYVTDPDIDLEVEY